MNTLQLQLLSSGTPSGLSPHLKALAIFLLLLKLHIVTFPVSWGCEFSGVAVISHHRLGGFRLVLSI